MSAAVPLLIRKIIYFIRDQSNTKDIHISGCHKGSNSIRAISAGDQNVTTSECTGGLTYLILKPLYGH